MVAETLKPQTEAFVELLRDLHRKVTLGEPAYIGGALSDAAIWIESLTGRVVELVAQERMPAPNNVPEPDPALMKLALTQIALGNGEWKAGSEAIPMARAALRPIDAKPDAWLVVRPDDEYRYLSGGEGEARTRMRPSDALYPLYRGARQE